MNSHEALAHRLDLRALQSELQAQFDHYDLAVDAGDVNACLDARSQIIDLIRPSLAPITSQSRYGIYLFLDRTQTGPRGIIYVGCAHAGDLRKRIESYLVRDISSMDRRMPLRTHEEAMTVARRRLEATMPATSAITLEKYVQGHMRSLRLTSGGLLLVAPGGDSAQIKGAEAMLICTAWSLGARLENRECKWPSPALTTQSRDFALRVLDQWSSVGLPQPMRSDWDAALMRLAVD